MRTRLSDWTCASIHLQVCAGQAENMVKRSLPATRSRSRPVGPCSHKYRLHLELLDTLLNHSVELFTYCTCNSCVSCAWLSGILV
jgi:hypothetical protein